MRKPGERFPLGEQAETRVILADAIGRNKLKDVTGVELCLAVRFKPMQSQAVTDRGLNGELGS